MIISVALIPLLVILFGVALFIIVFAVLQLVGHLKQRRASAAKGAKDSRGGS